MSGGASEGIRRWWKPCLLIARVAAAGAIADFALTPCTPAMPSIEMRPESRESTDEEVHRLCAACHAYPPPDSFPKSAWRKEVKQGYDFFHEDSRYQFEYPPLESVVARRRSRCRREHGSRRSGSQSRNRRSSPCSTPTARGAGRSRAAARNAATVPRHAAARTSAPRP